jgi:predicted transcriptional regulator
MNARNIITNIVNKIPGIRYKELQRVTKMPNGTLSYHIDMLMKDGIVMVRRDAGSTRLFPVTMDEYTAEIISLLKDDIRLRIVKRLLKGSATYQELHKLVNRSFSTLSWHLGKLIDANIVYVKNIIGMNEYYIRDPELINNIIEEHLDIVDNFIDTWGEL